MTVGMTGAGVVAPWVLRSRLTPGSSDLRLSTIIAPTPTINRTAPRAVHRAGRLWRPGSPMSTDVRSRIALLALPRWAITAFQYGRGAQRRSVGEAGQRLLEDRAERCSRPELAQDTDPPDPDAVDQQVLRREVDLHGRAHPLRGW